MQNARNKILISVSIIAGIIALVFSVLFYSNQKQVNVNAAEDGWLTGYSKRKAVTITKSNSGTAGTVSGNPVLGSSGKFGTAASLDGSGDYISFSNSDDWNFGTGDFTIDFWVYVTTRSSASYNTIMSRNGTSSYDWMISPGVGDGTGDIYKKFHFYSPQAGVSLTDSTVLPTGQWIHVAVVRNGNNWNLYKNGVSVASATSSGSISGTDPLNIGRRNGEDYFNGLIDEVRISKGIARWTSNFTPPTSAYSNDQYTKLLLHLNEASGATTVYSDSTLTDYQVPLTVAYDSDMQADFDDLRFTSSDGSTLLNYWLESKTDSSTAKVWVKVPSIASGSNTIYMYYGNDSVASVGNGTNTFVFFDDFNDGIIDSSKWTASGTWTESGGTIVSPSGTMQYLRSATEVLSGLSSFVVEGRTKPLHTYGYGMRIGLKTGATPSPNDVLYEPIVAYTYAYYSPLININGSTSCSGGTQATVGTWYKGKIVLNPGNSTVYEYSDSGTLISSCTTSATSVGSGNYLAIFNADGRTEQDWIFLRKYASSEPTSSFGSEEDFIPPTIAQVTAVPSPTSDNTPNYTFSSTEAGTITYGGDCSSSTTSAVSGNNTVTFNALAEGTHSNCTIRVTDSSNNQSSILSVNSFTIASNSCWYCEHYFNTSNVLQAGKNGQLDFTFKYNDSNSSATLSGYRIAIDTENLSLANIDSQADIISPGSSTWNAGGSAAPGATITYSGTSVKVSPSAALYQIGYGNGSSVKTYYWWVKVRNSAGLESDWTPGPSFNTPKKHYPIVRVVADKATIITNTNIQYCSGTDLSNQADPESRDACYSTCWTGTAGSAVVDPDNTNWKCSVCYNSSGSPVSCSTLNDGNTNFTWKVPTGYVEDTDYAMVSGTLTSANPVIKFLTAGTNLSMGLNITGSECGAEQLGDIKKGFPTWREIAPF